MFLKGDRCYTDKCALTRRPNVPGQHGAARKGKMSNYGTQLREKQKVKRFYGMLENQFRLLYHRAEKMHGITGENMLQLLELRLDNTVFRMGFANSRKEARQLVTHGHFTINGKKADIPSMQVKVGDVIAIKESSRSSAKIKDTLEKAMTVPKWIERKNEFECKVAALPLRDDIDLPIEEHLIVELYSK